jgi:DNA-binding MarR family transcriptional regulator
MHQVTWSVRRVFYRSIKVQEGLMERWDVTPGRFNMLFAVKCQRRAWFPQRKLRELLGVGASTISRKIESLVAKGFLKKRCVEGDRRRNEIALTKHAKRTVRCMFDNLIKSGLARRIVGHMLEDSPDSAPTSEADITRAIDEFLARMTLFRMNIEDMACFDYAHGLERECQMPGPTEIRDLTDYDHSCWPGDEEPVLWWLARL